MKSKEQIQDMLQDSENVRTKIRDEMQILLRTKSFNKLFSKVDDLNTVNTEIKTLQWVLHN
jgi:hypothetical protein